MVKSNDQSSIRISAALLNCLKQAIFSQTNGVDLSPIVEDLGGEDLTAIAVALAYKGIKPEIDDAPRFAIEYSDTYSRYLFKSYSVIKDLVLVSKQLITWNEETKHWDFSDNPREIEIPLYKWLSMSTSAEKYMAEIKAKYNKTKE